MVDYFGKLLNQGLNHSDEAYNILNFLKTKNKQKKKQIKHRFLPWSACFFFPAFLCNSH